MSNQPTSSHKPDNNTSPHWLRWARLIQSIAAGGLHYGENQYDIERYEQLQHLAEEMMANGDPEKKQAWRDLFATQYGYVTPKIDTRGVIMRDDKVLLVREHADGGWTFPGGWADVNLTLKQNVEREVWEESGLKVKAHRLLAVYDRDVHDHQPPMPFHIYKHFVHCEEVGGELATSHETTDVGFFHPDDLPPLSTSRVLDWQIKRMIELINNPEYPTDFD